MKKCPICKKEFEKPYHESKNVWNKRKFCSHKCYSESLKTNYEWKKKLSKIHKERPNRYWLGKKRPDISGENAYQWKGENVSYSTLHKWVRKYLGKPNKCDFCHRTDKCKYEWASIDQRYLRNQSAFIRLCTPCHRRWDILWKNNHYLINLVKLLDKYKYGGSMSRLKFTRSLIFIGPKIISPHTGRRSRLSD